MMDKTQHTKWQQRAPSWSTTLGLRHVHIPKSEGVQEELEFKKNSTWSTTLGLRHVYLPVCERKSLRLAAPWWAFPQLQQQRAPSWSTTLGLRHVYIPKSEGVQDELEFKKSSTWSTTLGLRHVYLPVCGRKSQVTSSRHIVVCLLAKKNHTKLLYICTCVFLDLWYFRVRVSLRMWQEI